jgi:hypothetical protein
MSYAIPLWATPHPLWATPHSNELRHTPYELRHTPYELRHTPMSYTTPPWVTPTPMSYATPNELVISSLKPYEVISHKHEQNLKSINTATSSSKLWKPYKKYSFKWLYRTYSTLKTHTANISSEQTLQRTVCIMVCALVAFIGGREIPIYQTFLF